MRREKLYDAFNYIDDWYLDIADAPAKENIIMKQKHFSARRMVVYVVAAAICVSLLAVTAAAAGLLPGLFSTLKDRYPQDEELFEAAAEANTDAVPEIAEIPKMDMSKLVLLERYYDGENILLGYNLDAVLPEPVVGVEPEEALLRKIRKGSRTSQVGWGYTDAWMEETVTENAIKYNFKQDGVIMDRMLKGILTPEQYDAAWKHIEANGYVCVIVHEAWIGDHIYINGQDLIDVYNQQENAYNGRTEYETEMGNCIRLDYLPDIFRNQEKLTISLNVRASGTYLYLDIDGNGRIYFDNSNMISEEVSFDLERSKPND